MAIDVSAATATARAEPIRGAASGRVTQSGFLVTMMLFSSWLLMSWQPGRCPHKLCGGARRLRGLVGSVAFPQNFLSHANDR